ncbi:MAG: restriction endonuclease [Bacteroidales bacterium]|nr:restriction endonuclease [Bacteroidales bacterium]
MKSEVKILLYPEEHKSKNGAFFEDLMRSVFKTQGYEIQQNINFTGLEIDLYAKHIDRNETLLIECKAKEKPKSTELKNFAFNVSDKDANFGYFVYTEELDHQAAGLKEEWEGKEKYKNLTFFGPEKIIKSLENSGKINNLNISEIEKYETINKKILAYTYFGIFYILIPFSGTSQKVYYLFDKFGNQIENVDIIADKEHSGIISIDKALKNGIDEIKKLQHVFYSSQKIEQKQNEAKQIFTTNKITKFAVLFPSPIDKNFDFSFNDILNKIEKLAVSVDFYFLTIENIQEIEGYDYVFIITETFKNKIYIEDERLKSKLIDFDEFQNNYIGDTKATILLINESIEIGNSKLPLICIASQDKKEFKNTLQSFLFKAFSKNDIHLLQSENIKLFNITQHNVIKIEKGTAIVNYQKTKLPDELECMKFQGFIGRKNDLQNIITEIFNLQKSGQVLNIKGSGGIGKTTIISKVAHEISLRGYFKQGISFVSCEFIQSYKIFEDKIAQCFKLDNIINLRQHLSDTFSQLEALIILDNFETILTLDNDIEVEEIKKLVEFISNYSIIVITSREKIGYDFEKVYTLENLTTDEALELFQKNCKISIKNIEDENILRTDIIENLLNNNPLAIKLITSNIPNNKDIGDLKRELEDDFEFFIKTSKDVDKIFDSKSDMNIERKQSLFQSINYSYQKLNSRAKIAFELLHLFPDGITHKKF